VTHSARATSRACGNAACSPQAEPGRPKNSALPGVSATSKQVPSIATSRRPARNTPASPRRPAASQRGQTDPAPARNPAAPWPERSPTSTEPDTAHTTPTPTTSHRPAPHTRPRTSPPRTAPSRSRSTRPRERATHDAAPACGPTPRSPHRPPPPGTPASTDQPTPNPTTGDQRPASPTQNAAYPPAPDTSPPADHANPAHPKFIGGSRLSDRKGTSHVGPSRAVTAQHAPQADYGDRVCSQESERRVPFRRAIVCSHSSTGPCPRAHVTVKVCELREIDSCAGCRTR